MQLYALIKPDLTEIIKEDFRDPSAVYTKEQLAPGKPYWVPVTKIYPNYNEATEVQEGPVIAINATSVTYTWTARVKTEQEKAAERAIKIASAPPDLLHMAIYEIFNRVRVLEGKLPITYEELLAEYDARIKALEGS